MSSYLFAIEISLCLLRSADALQVPLVEHTCCFVRLLPPVAINGVIISCSSSYSAPRWCALPEINLCCNCHSATEHWSVDPYSLLSATTTFSNELLIISRLDYKRSCKYLKLITLEKTSLKIQFLEKKLTDELKITVCLPLISLPFTKFK